ncbi:MULTISPECIES: hypothetical protein [Sorangium]|uniref:Uncharacterized protein n=1 Tax=Sorangium cellulosum (strain So ce56) TaxID=448385 RepID=A9GS73_SORC5|nr:hypothetical protein [Sorangium cellulosum]CAN93739.1 hypothetical protein predicted by Glimmer/Critica [Sorangium cellulosum So ce56]
MARPPKAAPAPVLPSSPAAALAAYGRVEPKLLELGPDDLVTVYVEVPRAVSSVLSALPHLRELRDEIVRDLPNHPIAMLDELEDFALAAWYADLLYSTPASELDAKKLTEDAGTLREGLLVAAEALGHRNLLDKQRVADIRKGKGHADLASDLIALAELFRGSWDKVRAKTAVEDEELERAADLGVRLLAALAAKPGKGSSAAPKITDAGDRRARAISLVAKAYEECRRAVAYLRWHEGGDGDLAPSLLQKPRGRRPNAEKAAAAASSASSEAPAKAPDEEASAAEGGELSSPEPANDAAPVAGA